MNLIEVATDCKSAPAGVKMQTINKINMKKIVNKIVLVIGVLSMLTVYGKFYNNYDLSQDKVAIDQLKSTVLKNYITHNHYFNGLKYVEGNYSTVINGMRNILYESDELEIVLKKCDKFEYINSNMEVYSFSINF